MGGREPFYNEVWYSTNGANWTFATYAPWSARAYPGLVVFDNKMWVIGGWTGTTSTNDVWYSANGINWTQATANAGWSARYIHTAVVFDNKMWVIGGSSNGTAVFNDVWYSTNGVNWTCATASAMWAPRLGHTTVVRHDSMWVMGGWGQAIGCVNDVWYSINGINWTLAAYASWNGRFGHSANVLHDTIWVIAGLTDYNLHNDVWYSRNGINWIQVTPSTTWPARCYHTSVVYNNKMWLMGGLYDVTGNALNDVWYSSGLGIEEGIENCKLKIRNYSVFPNPSSSYFVVRGEGTLNKVQGDKMTVKIFDVTGKIVKGISGLGVGDWRISLDGIKNGIYFIKVNDKILSEKLIVTK
jgi:hypothetical protein